MTLPSINRALRMFTNGTDTVVAEDLDDVRRILVEEIGYSAEEFDDDRENWREVPADHKTFKIIHDDGSAVGGGPKTVAEWIAFNGRGFLSSTEA